MLNQIADAPARTQRKIIIVLQPEVAIPPDLLRTDQWQQAAPFNVLRALHPALKPRRYFTSTDEWAVPHPSAPPTPLPGSERGARYFYIEPIPGADAEILLNILRDQSVVETAYQESPADEPPTTMEPENDPLSAYQAYLGPPPQGIDAVHAWELGVIGHGASFIDVEQGWFLDHEDLIAHQIGRPLSGVSREFKDHGTSVLGQLIASDNQSGVIGIAPHATCRVVSEWRDSITRKTADALLFAVSHMRAGEVLLIQAQTRAPSAGGALMPVEIEDANFEVIAFAALQRGVVVIEPAGNGGVDLDQFEHPKHGLFLNRASPASRDSGAIMVGAATLGSTSRVADSSYGSRIDCFALGERITTAHGKNDYTHVFSQTSGASAIIAGAALLLQSWRSLQGREPLNALEMRNLLGADVNTVSGGGDRIGVMPNLRILITP
jgi:hypothetical protein